MARMREIFDRAEAKGFKEISFSLLSNRLKPVFVSAQNGTNHRFVCMLDSGAGIPVWCLGSDSLRKAFPDAKLQSGLKGLLSGFGVGAEIVDVYLIPKIEISNGRDSVIFFDFYLPVVDKRTFGADLILPSSMLKNSNLFLSQSDLSGAKELIFQCRSLQFKTKYTKYPLKSFKVAEELRKAYKNQTITIDTAFLGGEDEFEQLLTQEENRADCGKKD